MKRPQWGCHQKKHNLKEKKTPLFFFRERKRCPSSEKTEVTHRAGSKRSNQNKTEGETTDFIAERRNSTIGVKQYCINSFNVKPHPVTSRE